MFFTTHYMEEAARIAQRIAIIDHGEIVASGNAQELMRRRRPASLEDAFLKLTGNVIRDEESSATDRLRSRARAWGGRRR